MARSKLLELDEELLPGLVVITQGFNGYPALGEQVVERRGAVCLLDAHELTVRPERIGNLQAAAPQAPCVYRVLVEKHVSVLLGDLLVVPVLVMLLAAVG